MSKIPGLIEKPQFDADLFEEGKAIHINQEAKSNGYQLMDTDALISEFNPLKIEVTYYSKSEHEITSLIIKVQDVISGEFTISFLREER